MRQTRTADIEPAFRAACRPCYAPGAKPQSGPVMDSAAEPLERRIWPRVLLFVGAPVGLLLLTGYFFAALLLGAYNVASNSMLPTLLIGDDFYIVKTLGRDEAPRRGDVMVFVDRSRGVDRLSRIVGLPGDRIQMLDGVLHIDDIAVPRELAGDYLIGNAGPRATRYLETLPGGRSHDILELTDDGMLDDTEVFIVPPGHLFVLGDNRDNSLDSRTLPQLGGLGFIPIENLIGRVTYIFWSDDLRRIGTWVE